MVTGEEACVGMGQVKNSVTGFVRWASQGHFPSEGVGAEAWIIGGA